MTTIIATNDGNNLNDIKVIVKSNGNAPLVKIEGKNINLEGYLQKAWLVNPWGTYAQMWMRVSLVGFFAHLDFQVKEIICEDISSLDYLAHRYMGLGPDGSSNPILKYESFGEEEVESFKYFPVISSIKMTGHSQWILEYDEDSNEYTFCPYE